MLTQTEKRLKAFDLTVLLGSIHPESEDNQAILHHLRVAIGTGKTDSPILKEHLDEMTSQLDEIIKESKEDESIYQFLTFLNKSDKPLADALDEALEKIKQAGGDERIMFLRSSDADGIRGTISALKSQEPGVAETIIPKLLEFVELLRAEGEEKLADK